MSTFRGWRIVSTLAVTETISWGVLYYAYSVIQVPMGAELGLTPTELGTGFAVAILATGLSGVLVGRLLDLHGGRVVTTVGAVASSAAVAIWSQVNSVAGLYAAMLVLGATRPAVLYEPAFAIVVRWFRERRARALLAITTLGGLASTIALPATNILVTNLGWRDALLALAGLLLVTTALPHWLVIRSDPSVLGQHPDGALAALAVLAAPARDAAATGHEPAFTGLLPAARWAVRQRSLRWFAIAFGSHAAGVVIVVVGIVPYLRSQGHSPATAAAAAGALGMMSVCGRWVLTGLGRWVRVASAAAVLCSVQAGGIIALLAAPSSGPAVVAFVVLFGIGFGMASVTRPAVLATNYGVARFATIAGLLALVNTLVTAGAPVASGVVQQLAGGGAAALSASAALVLLAALALRRAERLTACESVAQGAQLQPKGEPGLGVVEVGIER